MGRTVSKTRVDSLAGSPRRRSRAASAEASDMLWYKNAVIYQLHVRSFCDSTSDGIGDFNGLISKLDYLADLGVTAIWLLPFYPSPLRDDGYDIADFTSVNPSYGAMADVRRFIEECHRRKLRVITELVVNHTSDQHPWFQRARRAPKGSPERNFYVWSDTPDKYSGTRIIFKDFETSNWAWDPVAHQYYWHRFYSHQPDLNFDNPAVQEAVLKTCSFWMDLGVDGMRLDAIPYLYEREGTSCENLPETHAFLKKLRKHVDTHHPGRMLLAEANQWPEDAVAYFGTGDECHMSFHFPLMPRLFMSLRMEDRYPIIDILDQTPALPPTCQWAVFLRNHDELTLEMVTDEERDYMYRVYASDVEARINLGIRRRLAPLLSNNRRKIELMNGLLFSMPGTPIVYYGDEIGMGDNVHLGDRDGVRTPMQWSADRNAGFSRANPQRLFLPAIIDPEYHYETVNVESQQGNPSSMLWWMKRLIALRKRYPVFGRGEMRFVQPDNPRVLAYIRKDEQSTVLVVANLSRFVQPFSVALAEFEGLQPVEMFGRIKFPVIGKDPFFMSLGPHGFCWFELVKTQASAAAGDQAPDLREIAVSGAAEKALLSDSLPRDLEQLLPSLLQQKRWFASKARTLRGVRITDKLLLPVGGLPKGSASIMLAKCEFSSGEPESYAIPLAIKPTPADGSSPAAIARIRSGGEMQHELIDGMTEVQFARTLLRVAMGEQRVGSDGVRLLGTRIEKSVSAQELDELPVRMPKLEQSNTTVFFGDKYMLKMYRRVQEGENPELEIGRHLTGKVGFGGVAPLAGAVELADTAGKKRTLAVVFNLIASEGDAWQWILGRVEQFMERAAATASDADRLFVLPPDDPFEPAIPPAALAELLAEPLQGARLLGERTAQMHAALADDRGDPAFTPEPFTLMYQRSLFQSMRNTIRNGLAELQRAIPSGNPRVAELAREIAGSGERLLAFVQGLGKSTLSGSRIRVHGDYHLGQVLWTGRDFVIIDFEGEPMRSIGERRLKRSPLRDVAGMIRSFDYAARAGWKKQVDVVSGGEAAQASLDRAAAAWSAWMSRVFTAAYAAEVDRTCPGLLGSDPASRRLLLNVWLIEKAMYEITYELNSRPDWLEIPLRAVRQLLEPKSASGGATPSTGGAA
ncbi:MAG: maltose alpha-D-glucosyltransferase [Phycisphaeraceae bacterium]|nr:maltose alpha-D-glucosyltransferase [Phycisphaeraceae bacterium]